MLRMGSIRAIKRNILAKEAKEEHMPLWAAQATMNQRHEIKRLKGSRPKKDAAKRRRVARKAQKIARKINR